MITTSRFAAIQSWWDRFWFSPTDPRIYAVLRIAFGALGLIVLAGLMPSSEYWSCTGLVASRFGRLCEGAPGGMSAWIGPAILAGAAAAFAAMLAGVLTRLSTAAAFVALLAIARWNALPLSSAHQVFRALLFCLIWADCGQVLSVDAWWRRRHSGEPAQDAPVWPLRLFQVQIATIYLVTAIWKLCNASWQDGSALHYVLENAQFHRFPALAAPAFDAWTTMATYGTLAWELGFAAMICFPRTRRVALAVGVAAHLAMWALLEVGTFSGVMLASYLSFLPAGGLAGFSARGPLSARPKTPHTETSAGTSAAINTVSR